VKTAAKLALGAATGLALVYIVLFLAFVVLAVWIASHEPPDNRATLSSAVVTIFAVHIGMVVEIIALVIFYVVDAFRNPRIAADQRLLWAVLIFVGGPIAMVVYWYLNIWRSSPVSAQRPLEQG
jgi:hypothetical protein